MRIAVVTTYVASRKEPLADMLSRVHQGFVDAGIRPEIEFSMTGSDAILDRVLKRFPQLKDFDSTAGPMRQIAGKGAADFATLHEIAAGVPRSFPFQNIAVQFRAPELASEPGVQVGDSWWVSGRQRSLLSQSYVEVEKSGKKLPPPEGPLATILAACGKAKKVIQTPLAPGGQADPQVLQAVSDVVMAFKSGYVDYIRNLPLPHDLPPAIELLKSSLGLVSGPKKPPLVDAFRPLGYSCHGESGTFTLRRKTPANLHVEISLDVGTWSNSLTGFYTIKGFGFGTRLTLPVSKQDTTPMQYPIGDASRWKQIVENLATLVAALDRDYVPKIESASGPAPDWFTPEK